MNVPSIADVWGLLVHYRDNESSRILEIFKKIPVQNPLGARKLTVEELV